MTTREHFYRNVPGHGSVAVSRHAQARMDEDDISQELFEKVLLTPPKADIPDGQEILWREGYGVRIVIIVNPTPNYGARLVKTVYRIEAQAVARKGGPK